MLNPRWSFPISSAGCFPGYSSVVPVAVKRLLFIRNKLNKPNQRREEAEYHHENVNANAIAVEHGFCQVLRVAVNGYLSREFIKFFLRAFLRGCKNEAF